MKKLCNVLALALLATAVMFVLVSCGDPSTPETATYSKLTSLDQLVGTWKTTRTEDMDGQTVTMTMQMTVRKDGGTYKGKTETVSVSADGATPEECETLKALFNASMGGEVEIALEDVKGAEISAKGKYVKVKMYDDDDDYTYFTKSK